MAAVTPPEGVLAGRSLTGLDDGGQVEIAGRVYLTPERVARMLAVTVRTLARWNAARIGPPKIKVGKLVLYQLSQLPEWLSSRESEPVRARRH